MSFRNLNSEERILCENSSDKCSMTMLLGQKAMTEENYRYTANDNSHGNSDAFRHGIWCALMAKHIDEKWALDFSTAHEKGDISASEISKKMDSFNNKVGIELGSKYCSLNDDELANVVEDEVDNGSFRLIKNGKLSPTNTKNKSSNSIFWSILNKALSILIRLVSIDKHINSKNSDGRTPLMLACSEEYLKGVEIVLGSKRANVNAIDSYGDTALIIASTSNDLKILQAVVNVEGVNPNYQTPEYKETALMCASSAGIKENVELLSNFSDKSLKNSSGHTAYDLAKIEGHDSILSLLRVDQ